MAVLPILTVPNPLLRKKCKEVTVVDDAIRSHLQDLEDTLLATDNGAAIAAPQVGILLKLIVIKLPDGGILKLVNPRITHREGKQEVVEGCLSLPGKFGYLVRPTLVRVEALKENGEKTVINGTGFMAKCLCHEIDHLSGIVFSDRVTQWLPDEEV